jgi:quinolinate synthase
VGSTAQLIDFVKHSGMGSAMEFIVATEPGVLHQMRRVAPGKTFFAVTSVGGDRCNECSYMKLNTLEKVAAALENLAPEIFLDQPLLSQAEKSIRRMLEISKRQG